MPVTVFTVGHSNRTLDALLGILRAHGIECLADVRSVPRSRHNPQFNAEALEKSLPPAGITYAPLPRLGGLRKPRRDSRNLGWRNDSFRGYADYMETPEFEKGIAELLALARDKRTAIMCAEAVYFRCHRSLISDALVCRGVETVHLLDEKKTVEHPLTPFAKIEDGRPTYPAGQASLPGTGPPGAAPASGRRPGCSGTGRR
jgi:uncharacterized protein (DUF488 family)